jgi:hypothetical protein
MSMYTTPIPAEVIERVWGVVSTYDPHPFDVRIQAFDDDGEQAFSIDVYTNPERIVPTDKRQKPYTEATRTSYFLDAEGVFTDGPQAGTTRYQG